jgi:hypothetical protein
MVMPELVIEAAPLPIRQQVVDFVCPNCAQDGFVVWEQIGNERGADRLLVFASHGFHIEPEQPQMSRLIVCKDCHHVVRT